MPQTVNVPGVGSLQFPDGMSQEEMASAIQRNFPQIHGGQVPQESEGKAQGKRILSDIDQYNHEHDGPIGLLKGAGETALNLVTGIGSSIVGGLHGYGKTLSAIHDGKSMDDAIREGANTVQEDQQKYTYQPRTGVGKLGTEVVSLPFNIAKSALSSMGGDVGQAINGTQGRIAGEAIGDVLPDVAGTLMGGRAAIRAAPSLRAYIDSRTAASAAKFNAEDAAALAGEPMPPVTPIQTAHGPQSAGAAAADHINMATAAGASPEILSVIQQAGDNTHPLAAARHAEASSLPVPIPLTAGEATGNAALASAEKNSRGKFAELSEFYDKRDPLFIENFDELHNKVAPDVSARGSDLGQMAVDAIKERDAAERADISAKYKALEDANGGDFPLNARDFVVTADEALKKANRARFLPSEVQGILSDLREGGQMTFGDFENFRTILAEQSRKHSGDGTASYAINLVRNALENLPMIEESATLKPLADAARNAARTRFNRLNTDPAYKAAVNDITPLGEPSPLADAFIKNYVVNGRTANVGRLVQNLSDNPLNQQILAAGLIDHLKSASGVDLRTNTGNISQAGLNNTINTLGKKANIVLGDDVANTVNTLGNVARYTMKQSKGQFVNNSNTDVSNMARGAKDAALGVVDHKTFGATKLIRDVFEKRAQEQAARRSIAPGAGINYADFPALKAEMERNNAAPVEQSKLQAYIAETKQKQAMENLSRAQSIDEAIKAVSDQ